MAKNSNTQQPDPASGSLSAIEAFVEEFLADPPAEATTSYGATGRDRWAGVVHDIPDGEHLCKGWRFAFAGGAFVGAVLDA